MEFAYHANNPVAHDLSSADKLDQLCVDKDQFESPADGGLVVENLGNNLSKSLNVQEACESVESSDLNGSSDAEGGNNGEGTVDEVKSSGKCLSKSATFPSSGDLSHSHGSEDNGEHGSKLQVNCNHPCDSIPRSLSLPSPLTLVSAMKGSRENQGTSPKKLTVRWAADVYDPTPSIVSHTVKGKPKKQPKFDKKSGKGKQKGSKASRGNNGKDKKRKIAGNSKRCYKSLDVHDKIVGFDDPSEDFDVGGACGSSFLRNSLTSVHISVTEAL